MTARRCPTCDTERQPDGRSGCDCAAREVAAAEDFDPLRIRPYVRLSEPEEPPDETPPVEETPAERPGASAGKLPEAGPPSASLPEPAAAGPEAVTGPVHLGHGPAPGTGDGSGSGADGGVTGRSRRRRAGVLVVATAAVLLVCAGLLGAALLGGDDADRAQPDEPTATPTAMMPTSGPTNSPSASGSPTEQTSPSPSSSRSASPSASRSAAPPPAPSRPASPESSAAEQSERPDEDDDSPPVLRMGSSGPEVVELQERLTMAGGVYYGSADGEYDSRVRDAVARFQEWRAVKGDPEGVYGPHTRKTLEDETDDRYPA